VRTWMRSHWRRRGHKVHPLILLAGGTCIASLLALAACSSSSPGSSGSSNTQPTKAALHIGVIEDETGANATTNVPQVNGLKAWQAYVNDTGGIDGHPVDLQFCDSQTSVTAATTCASQVASDGIVIENGLTGEMNAAAAILQQEGKVDITVTPTENPPSGSNLFQASPGLATGVATILQTAKANHITNVGLVTDNSASGTFEVGAFTKTAPGYGVTFEDQTLPTGSVDATIQVSKLQADHVGLLYVGTLGASADVVVEAAKTEGVTVPIVVNAGNVNDEFLRSIANAMPNQIYGAPFSDFEVPSLLTGAAKAAVGDFLSRYRKVTGTAWDFAKQDLAVPVAAAAAASVLAAVGPDPSLQAAEHYILTHPLPGIATLQFPSSGVQDASLPIRLAEATKSSTSWGVCTSSALLTC
jgi:ABC-type branched-subunit amino acid transport system substrate-binding protein